MMMRHMKERHLEIYYGCYFFKRTHQLKANLFGTVGHLLISCQRLRRCILYLGHAALYTAQESLEQPRKVFWGVGGLYCVNICMQSSSVLTRPFIRLDIPALLIIINNLHNI